MKRDTLYDDVRGPLPPFEFNRLAALKIWSPTSGSASNPFCEG